MGVVIRFNVINATFYVHFLCLQRRRVLAASRRYSTPGYQGLQRPDSTETVSGPVEGHFGTETVVFRLTAFTLNLITTLNLEETRESFGETRFQVYSQSVRVEALKRPGGC